MSRPAWWLKNRFLNHGGGRLPKWKPLPKLEDVCPTCDAEIKTTHKHWMIESQRWQCHACWLRLSNRFKPIVGTCDVIKRPRDWNRAAGFAAGVMNGPVNELSEEGNLDSWMYRFWIGTKYVKGSTRICKCCRKAGYTKAFSDEHNNDQSPSCYRRLVDAYKSLINRKLCVCCGSNTFRQEWGVPLCSDICVSEWKFNQVIRWKLLEAALRETGGFITPVDGGAYSHAQLVD